MKNECSQNDALISTENEFVDKNWAVTEIVAYEIT